jgi:hypothetical protein
MRAGHVKGAVVLATVALAFGCLAFEEQILTVRYDADQDRLTLVIDYRGLYAETEDAKGTAFYQRDVQEAEAQLDRAVVNRTVALFGNWPLALDLPELRANGVPEDWAEPLIRARINRFVQGVSILNAGFYRDAAGRPCGMQVVTMEEATEGLALANEFLNRQIRSALVQRLRGGAGDEVTSQIPGYLMGYVERGHKWIELGGGSVVLNLPFSDSMPDDDRRQLLGHVFLATEDEVSAEPKQFADRLGNTVLLAREGDVLKATYEAKDGVIRLRARESAGGASAELAAHIEAKQRFGLDVRLARFLVDPAAAAGGDADRAARLAAPLLAPHGRLRVLLHAAEKQQLPAYWEALRREASAQAPDAGVADKTREDLAALCRGLLGQPAGTE